MECKHYLVSMLALHANNVPEFRETGNGLEKSRFGILKVSSWPVCGKT